MLEEETIRHLHISFNSILVLQLFHSHPEAFQDTVTFIVKINETSVYTLAGEIIITLQALCSTVNQNFEMLMVDKMLLFLVTPERQQENTELAILIEILPESNRRGSQGCIPYPLIVPSVED